MTTYSYDAANQLLGLANARAGIVLSRFTYSYDNAANRTNVREATGDKYGRVFGD